MTIKKLTITLLAILLVSCGQSATIPAVDNQKLIDDHIMVEYDHVYKNSTVKLSVKFAKTTREVWFGIDNKLVKSKNMPQDNVWTDTIALNERFAGEKTIYVTFTTQDWEKKTLYKAITVVEKPEVNIEQKRSSKSGDKLIVWADVPLTKVDYIQPDGTIVPLNQTDKQFTLDVKLPQPGKPAGIIKTTDTAGAVIEKKLTASDYNLPMMYYIEGEYKFDEIARVGRMKVMESPIDFSYKKTAFEIVLKQAQDDDLDRLYKIRTDPMFTPDLLGYVWLKVLSKDRKWVILTTSIGSGVKDNIIEDGKLLQEITVIFTYLYNTQTREQKLIGKRLIKNYTGYVCETGSVFFPVLIEDDEIVMIEQIKDGKMHMITTHGNDQQNLYRTPEATARGVALSLKDQTIRPSDKVKPISPWVNWAMLNNGFIEYAELSKDCLECGLLIPDGHGNTGITSYFSDIQGKNVVTESDFRKLCAPFAEGKFTQYNGVGTMYAYKEDNKTVMYIGAEYENPIRRDGEWEGPERPPDPFMAKFFKYTLETKKLEPFTPVYRDSNNKEYKLKISFFANCYFGLKYPLFFASYGDEVSRHLDTFYLRDGEFIKISDGIRMSGGDNRNNHFIFPDNGGEQ